MDDMSTCRGVEDGRGITRRSTRAICSVDGTSKESEKLQDVRTTASILSASTTPIHSPPAP